MVLPRVVAGIISVGLMILRAGVASAQDFPTKPIRINASEAGGGADFVARLIAQGISGPLGQPVVIENGNTTVGAESVAKSAPDGHSLIVSGSGLWVATLLQKLPYDVVRDFAPITLVTRQVQIFAVHPSVPVKSVKELIALAKARPGALNVATGVIGGPNHLATELFKHMAGIDFVSIRYKGSPQAISALITGEVQLAIYATDLLLPHLKSGRLRPLAVTTITPSRMFPELPTVSASGLPGYEISGLTGIYAPIKTPPAIVNRLYQEIARTLAQPDVRDRILANGQEPVGNSPQEFAAIIKADVIKMDKLIKDANIKIL